MIDNPFLEGHPENQTRALMTVKKALNIFSMSTPHEVLQENVRLFREFEINLAMFFSCHFSGLTGKLEYSCPFYADSMEERLNAISNYLCAIAIYREHTPVGVMKKYAKLFRQFSIYEHRFIYSVLIDGIKIPIRDFEDLTDD